MEFPRDIQIHIIKCLDWQTKLRLGIKPGKLNIEKYEKLLSPVFEYKYKPANEELKLKEFVFIKEYYNQRYYIYMQIESNDIMYLFTNNITGEQSCLQIN